MFTSNNPQNNSLLAILYKWGNWGPRKLKECLSRLEPPCVDFLTFLLMLYVFVTPWLCFNMWASMSPESITKKKTRDILNKKEPRICGKAFIYFSHGVFYPIIAQILPLHHHFPSLFIPSPRSFAISCLPLSWTGNKGAFSFHLSGKEALGSSDFSECNTTKGTFFSFFSC